MTVAVVISALLPGGCSGDDDGDTASSTTSPAIEVVGDAVTMGDDALGSISAAPQRSSGHQVLVEEAVLTQGGGYVVVYEDSGGAPGRILGSSPLLEAGSQKGVLVGLSSGLSHSAQVWVMIHREDGGNDTFDFPDGDQPVTAASGVAVVPVAVEVAE